MAARRDRRTVAEVLRARRAELTPSELRVAQALLADYPAAGLQTVAALATAADVSAPTVVRLVAKLGFASYPDLQQRLRAELSARTAGPVELYPEHPPGVGRGAGSGSAALRRAPRLIGQAVSRSLQELDSVELGRAVDLLADRERPVVVAGGRVSVALAGYLAGYLTLLRPGAGFLADRAARDAGLLDVGRRTTVVVFDYRRYDNDVVAFGQESVRRGGRLLLFTDPYLSPLSSSATVLLTTVVDGPPPFLTLAPALAVVEALVTGVVEALGPRTRRRLEALDRLSDRGPR
jgi:DNA-binding MurR/RpiR family transcriptional regulator